MSDSLFISDLHLTPERPEIIKLFLTFMDEVVADTKSLYILGDLLEYWIGDDMDKLIQNTAIEDVFNAIKTANEKGVNVYFMHGNRDFLVGQAMCDKYKFNLITDPTTIEINNTQVLLMHGDTLCTDDKKYQNFRRMVRDDLWQTGFLAKTLEEREEFTKELREKTKASVADKKPDIMDVNLNTVTETMLQHNVTTLIHGHTHRPGVHDIEHEGKTMKRYVLTDWYESGGYLEVTDGKFKACDIS